MLDEIEPQIVATSRHEKHPKDRNRARFLKCDVRHVMSSETMFGARSAHPNFPPTLVVARFSFRIEPRRSCDGARHARRRTRTRQAVTGATAAGSE
ncbi:hypothetical protein QZM22_17255 [Burkholderia oklahomensis]|uniref:hypothetical protein n=1 Tax=Burkholderia oklahomensis TaxID=342113 RepID=UPI0026519C2F|nr:hypothetical protein [Burkholderia oklahomensis]MDN7674220.1 hypothetical protein [Burkholderia oklahomensis]